MENHEQGLLSSLLGVELAFAPGISQEELNEIFRSAKNPKTRVNDGIRH